MEDSNRIMYKRSQVLREYVASFHLLTMFIGFAFISIGAYLINSNTSQTISILLLTVGLIVTITSFIGCFGAHLEHTGFLNTYSSITAIALILELVAMGLGYTHQDQLDHYGSLVWDFFKDNDAQFLLELEQSIKCCGYASIGDRPIPKTCSVTLGVETGCRDLVVAQIRNHHQWITIALIFFLAIQFVSLLLSAITSFIMDRETREEETYNALLLSRNHHITSPIIASGSSNGYFHRSSQRSISRYGSTPSTHK